MPVYKDWGGLLNVQIQGPILKNSDSAGPEDAFEQHLSLRCPDHRREMDQTEEAP